MFPSTLSSFTNPLPTDRLNSPSHSSIETAQNAGISQVEAVIGVEGSPSVVGSLQYLIKSNASYGGGHVQGAAYGGTGQTTFIKGDILVAPSASDLSKLAIGTAGQALIVDTNAATGVRWGSVAGVPSSVLTMIPKSPLNSQYTQIRQNSATVANVGQVVIPFPIVVNNLAIRTGDAVDAAGTFDITLYREDGLSSILTVTTPTISATQTVYSTAVSSVAVLAGNYYVMINSNGSADSRISVWDNRDFSSNSVLSIGAIPGYPVQQGTYTIASGAPPASIKTTALTSILNGAGSNTLVFRLDY